MVNNSKGIEHKLKIHNAKNSNDNEYNASTTGKHDYNSSVEQALSWVEKEVTL